VQTPVGCVQYLWDDGAVCLVNIVVLFREWQVSMERYLHVWCALALLRSCWWSAGLCV
jgi:hypothetical protein